MRAPCHLIVIIPETFQPEVGVSHTCASHMEVVSQCGWSQFICRYVDDAKVKLDIAY